MSRESLFNLPHAKNKDNMEPGIDVYYLTLLLGSMSEKSSIKPSFKVGQVSVVYVHFKSCVASYNDYSK